MEAEVLLLNAIDHLKLLKTKMSTEVKSCQSCGLPLNKDPMGGGTNQDGSKSDLYCSYCYKEGAFVQPNWTAEEMQAYVIKVLQKKGVPEFLGKMLSKGIPQLKRWKTKN